MHNNANECDCDSYLTSAFAAWLAGDHERCRFWSHRLAVEYGINAQFKRVQPGAMEMEVLADGSAEDLADK